MLKKYTCIICPNGCEIEAEVLDGEIKSVSGFTCKRGEEYVRQEILAPKRTIASSVVFLWEEVADFVVQYPLRGLQGIASVC